MRSTREEADRPMIAGYPPPAQVAGVLFNAIFLDQLDADALQLRQINALIEAHAGREAAWDCGRSSCWCCGRRKISGAWPTPTKRTCRRRFRFFTRGLGTRETRSNDMLSLVMFQTGLRQAADRARRGGRAGEARRHRGVPAAAVGYSPRSALIGSMRSARSAGTTLATNAVAIITPAVTANDTMSSGCTE